MKIYHSLTEFIKPHHPVVTTGTFDGVHVGHQMIIGRLKEIASRENGETVALTFWPHPRKVLFPNDKGVRLLNTLNERLEHLELAGVDHCIVEPFTREFSVISAHDFLQQVMVDAIGVHCLVIGYDHHFGRNREGNIDKLREWAPQYGFKLEEIPAREIDHVNVSSTKIRAALKAGDIKTANKYLNYPYCISGRVIHGEKIGRQMGFPTANIDLQHSLKLIPANGVYIVRVGFDNHWLPGLVSIGTRPTIRPENREVTLEVYLLDFSGDLYNRQLEVKFRERLRDELECSSREELINKMKQDEEQARVWFAENGV